jgi:hypothetical protein
MGRARTKFRGLIPSEPGACLRHSEAWQILIFGKPFGFNNPGIVSCPVLAA